MNTYLVIANLNDEKTCVNRRFEVFVGIDSKDFGLTDLSLPLPGMKENFSCDRRFT